MTASADGSVGWETNIRTGILRTKSGCSSSGDIPAQILNFGRRPKSLAGNGEQRPSLKGSR
jgi:hypothetical protein